MKFIKKSELPGFLKKLMKKYEVIGPVKKNNTRFEVLSDPKDLYLDKNTEFSFKKFFLPPQEAIMNIKGGKLSSKMEVKPTIIFGARMCDINSLVVMDNLFRDETPDPWYAKRRDSTILIGLGCNDPTDEFCFCESMDLNKEDSFDLLLYDSGDKYFVKIGSKKGEALSKGMKEGGDYSHDGPGCEKELHKKDLTDKHDHPIWAEEAQKCMSCTPCTVLCPTCYCFDVEDHMDLDMKGGQRARKWDTCQLKSFTQCAGNHVFRPERKDRLKHRVMHKLQYFKDKFNVDMCTGCGRCIRYCPTKIDMVEIVNKI